MDQVEAGQLAQLPTIDLLVLDVRDPAEFASGHIAGALNIPLPILPLRDSEVSRNAPIYVVCETGARSAQGVMFLERRGIAAINVAGGMASWRQHRSDLVTGVDR